MMPLRRSLFPAVLVLGLVACQPGSGPYGGGDGPQRRPTTGSGTVFARINGLVQLEGADDYSGIQVYVPGTSLISITDANGYFAFQRVPPGSYEVSAKTAGHEQGAVGQVEVGPLDHDKAFSLPPVMLNAVKKTEAADRTRQLFGSVRGRVHLDGIDPDEDFEFDWSACTIELVDTPYRTSCSADGRFLLWNLPPDSYQLRARIEGFIPRTQRVRLLPGASLDLLKIAMKPAEGVASNRRIAGFVELIDAAGGPSNDFDLIVVEIAGRDDLVTKLGPDGSFSFTGLAPRTYIIRAKGEGYRLEKLVEVDLSDLKSIEVQLTMRATGPPQGAPARITGAAIKNAPDLTDMSGIQVALTGSSLMAITDAAGLYAIESIPPGTYELIAQANGFEPARASLELAPGDDVSLEDLVLEQVLDFPVVLGTDPPDGARNVMIEEVIPISVRFSKKMNTATLIEAISIDPPVRFDVEPGGALRDPDADLARILLFGAGPEPVAYFQTRYRITISEDARDNEGLPLEEPFKMDITTGRPAIIRTNPADDQIKGNIGPASPISVYFNVAMDPATLGTDTLRFRPRLPMSPNISVRPDPQTRWSILNIRATWQPDTRYRVTIGRRARTIGRDTLDNTPYSMEFRTEKLVEYEMPDVPEGVR